MAKKKITGYKAFNKDWSCRGFQYEVGKTFAMEEKPECCNQGFHFCTNVADCFKHYANNPKLTKIALVEALGDIDKEEDDSKCCTNKIKIVKEISFTDAYELGNQGKANTGLWNTGDRNTGDRNTGDRNTGDRNTGDWNTGDRNTGDWNTGNRNTGDRNTGDWNTGDWNTGNRNTGDWNTGNRNTGDWNSGSFNTCNHSAGMFNTKEQPLYLFNKPTDFTWEEFTKIFPNEYNLLFYSSFTLTEWVNENDMSDKEKEENPEYKTTGGYLRQRTYKEAWQIMWNSWTKEQQNSIKKLPNFDKDIFKEITGIEV